MDDAAHRVDDFAARLGLPAPDDGADAMLEAIEERHGEAAVEQVLAAFGARTDRERYRTLLADPALAVEVTWRYAGAATRALLAAVERSGVLVGARRILDLGSAEGVVPAYVAWSRPAAEVLATDLRPEAVQCVRHLAERLGLANLAGERVSLRRAPRRLRDGGWDVVLALRVLHELEPDAAAAFPLLRGLVAPGGAVVVAERTLEPVDLEARAAAAARAGLRLRPAEARSVPVRELDAEGEFPLYVLRR